MALLAAILVSVAVPARAGALPAGIQRAGTAVVADVQKGDALTLEDGRTVRLVGIQAPKPAATASGGQAWPLAGEAAGAAQALLAGQRVLLAFAGRKRDR